MRTTVLTMAVPAVAGWSNSIRASSGGIRGSCLQMEDVVISSTCDSSRHEKLTRFAFTMAQGSSGTAGPCNTPGEPVSLEFNAPVTSTFHLLREGGEVDNNKVTFLAEDHLELSVILDTTGLADGQAILGSGGSLRGPWTVPECNDANRSAAAISFGRKLRGTTPSPIETVSASETPATSGVADDVTPEPTAAPEDVEEDEGTTAAPAADDSTPSPTKTDAASPSEVEVNLDEDNTDDDDEDDCSRCFDLSSVQEEALITDNHGVKRIVCDATCNVDGADNTHCNYFGLGQICRGCGECDNDYCQPCPDESTPSPTFGTDLDDRETPSPATPAPSSAPVKDTPAPVTPVPTTATTLAPDVVTPSPTTTPEPSPAPVTETPETTSPTTAPVTETPDTTPPTTAPVDVATPSPTTTPEPSPAPATETPETTPPTTAPATETPQTTPPTTAPVTETPETTPPTTAPVTQTPDTTPPTTAPVDVVTPVPTTTPEPSPAPVTEIPETTPPTTAPVTETPETTPPTTAPITETPQTTPPTTVPVTETPDTTPPTTSPVDVVTPVPTTTPEPSPAPVTETPETTPPTTAPVTETPDTTPPTTAPIDVVTPVPTTTPEPSPAPVTETPETTPPTTAPVGSTPAPFVPGLDLDENQYDCSVCSEVSEEDAKALVNDDKGVKQIVCDPACVGEAADVLHCNYFDLGQICRGCGECDDGWCQPCPDATPSPVVPAPSPAPLGFDDLSTPSPVTPETPAPSGKPVMHTPSPETPETAPPTVAETPEPEVPTPSPTVVPETTFGPSTPTPVTPETPAPSGKPPVKHTPSPETPETTPPTVAETPAPKAIIPSPTMEPDLGFDPSTPSPVTLETPAPSGKPVKHTPSPETPETTPPTVAETPEPEVPTPSPTMMPLGADGAVDDDECSVCSNLTDEQVAVLASYDNGGKQVVCDPTCLDGVTDPLHCNYFSLGQICRGCGECSSCEPCPGTTPAPETTSSPTMMPDLGFDISTTPSPVTPETPAPSAKPVKHTPSPETPETTPPTVAETPEPEVPTPSPTMMPLGADSAVDDDECSVCSNLTDEQVAVLASYDNGGKQVVCDPTCLDGVTDPLHCNYFGLGQICRGCGECSSCEPCPGTTPAPDTTSSPTMMPDLGFDDLFTPTPVTLETPAPSAKPVKHTPSPETPETTPPTVAETPEPEVPTPSPTMMPLGADGAVDDDECSVCSNLTDEQVAVLASYDNGGKQVVCDPTCLDGVTDPLHCNYFGLGQICRGCGDCSLCEPCPGTTPAPETTSSPTMVPDLGFDDLFTPSPVTPETPAPSAKPVKHTPSPETLETAPPTVAETPEPEVPTPSPTMMPLGADGAVDDDECSVCSNLTEAQMESLAAYPDGGKQIICDPRCVDGSSDITHCNYFGLGQICRGCGDCDDCTPCP
ncbi:unnamed protein product [Ectocarpus sp. 6 AP-2014]